MIDSLIAEVIYLLNFRMIHLLLSIWFVGSLDSSSMALPPFFMQACKFKYCFADSTIADRKKS